MVCLIAVNNDVLLAFTCASATGNLQSICLGVNILNFLWLKTLQSETLSSETLATRATRAKSKRRPSLYIILCLALDTILQ